MFLKLCAFVVVFGVMTNCFAYTSDTGKVSRVYTSPSGAIAFQIVGGFKKADESGECENNNGWAGLVETDSFLKSLILAAKLSGQSVTVALEGCQGSWIKIKDIYLN